MKNNLIVMYQKNYLTSTGCNELQAVKKYQGINAYFELKEFLKSIDGKIIDVAFTYGDAFEKNDNNFWLPESLWEPI